MMRLAKNIFVSVVVAFFMSGMLLAAEESNAWKAAPDIHTARVQLLNDSATALDKSNPDLAKGLRDLAAAKWEKGEKGSADMKAKAEARKKLLNDASAALEKSNPDLSQKLKKMAEWKMRGRADSAGNTATSVK
jgi:hypothetical protein